MGGTRGGCSSIKDAASLISMEIGDVERKFCLNSYLALRVPGGQLTYLCFLDYEGGFFTAQYVSCTVLGSMISRASVPMGAKEREGGMELGSQGTHAVIVGSEKKSCCRLAGLVRRKMDHD